MRNRLFKILLFVLIPGAILFILFNPGTDRVRTPDSSLPATSLIADSGIVDTNKGGESDGGVLYNKNCAVCHQADGKGDGTRFPALQGSEWVKGNKSRLIGVVLNGLQGEIEVNGEEWNGVMPSFGPTLNDGEIASMLTYVRQEFGSKSDMIDSVEVAKIRQDSGKK